MSIFESIFGQKQKNIQDIELNQQLMAQLLAYIADHQVAEPQPTDPTGTQPADPTGTQPAATTQPATADARHSIPDACDRAQLASDADDFMEQYDSAKSAGLTTVADVEKMMFGYAKARKTFADELLRYIERTGKSNASIYKRANVSKSVFSGLISNQQRRPQKNTAIALALALELNLKEAERLLMKAGYTFSNSIVTDLVAVYCINHKRYDVDEINRILYEMGQPLLGSKTE